MKQQNRKFHIHATTLRPQQLSFFSLFLFLLLLQLSKMLRFKLAFSPPSTPFLKSSNKSILPRIYPISISPSVYPVGLGLRTSNVCSFTRFHSPFSSSPCLNQRFHSLKVRAASVPDSIEETPKSSAIHVLHLGGLFGLWYTLNIYFNIFNKQVLKIYPYPATITAFQLGCGTSMIILMWTFNLYPRPKLTRSQLATILPLAVAHTLGNLLTNVSLGKVNVSFTHTIKAMEPFFTVLFASLFLGEKPTFGIVSCLLPIVGGVALASFTEASFNWTGFCCAMASNMTNQSRNVLSKKFMVRKEDTLDNINLFSVITIISFILLVPVAIFLEGTKFTPSYLQFAASRGLNVKELCMKSLLAGFCFHSYQQVSYYILQLVSPITHSVGNCVKRVVVITASVIFFQIPLSPINALGTTMALAGVFLYSRAKNKAKAKDSII